MSLSTQSTFLVFLYARVLGFLGPEERSDPSSVLTLDGSPIEFSWIIPDKKVAKGKANRNIRCVMEPLCVLFTERIADIDLTDRRAVILAAQGLH